MEKPGTIQPGSDQPSVAKSPKSNRIQAPKKVYILLRGMNGGITRIDLNVYDDESTDDKPVWVTLTVRALIELLSEFLHSSKVRDELQRDSYGAADGLPAEVSDNGESKNESEGGASESKDEGSRNESEESRSEREDSESESEDSESEGESERHAKKEFDAPIPDKLQQDSLVNTEDELSAGSGTKKFDMQIPVQLLEILQLDEEGVMSAVPQDALAKTCVSFFVGDDLGGDAAQAGEDDPKYRLMVFDKDDNVAEIREVGEAAKNDLITDFLVKNDKELDAKNDSELAVLYAHNEDEVRRLLILYHVMDARRFFGVLHGKGSTRDQGLHFAVENGYMTEVACLLRVMQDLNVGDEEGKTVRRMAGADVCAANTFGWTSLHLAARKGHVKILKALLSAGSDIGATNDIFGWTALHVAAENGHVETVKTLLSAGANVGAIYDFGSTALHLAAEKGHVMILKALLSAGADIGAANHYAETALHVAAVKGHVESVKTLLGAGASVGAEDNHKKTPLLSCCSWHHEVSHLEEIAKCLVGAGADAHATADCGRTCLHFSAFWENAVMVNYFIAIGADIHAKSGYWGTALHCAVLGGDREIVKTLIEAGADVNARRTGVDAGIGMSVADRTALHDAARRRSFKMMKYLIGSGANIHLKDSDGETALHCAVIREDDALEFVDFLVKAGADTRTRNNKGDTPLHSLARWHDEDSDYEAPPLARRHEDDEENVKVLKYLIENGADINAKNHFGSTALCLFFYEFYIQESRNYLKIIKCLVEAGANINAMDVNFKTPFDRATEFSKNEFMSLAIRAMTEFFENYSDDEHKGYFELITYLLSAGAQVSAENQSGDRVLIDAEQSKDPRVVEVLRRIEDERRK